MFKFKNVIAIVLLLLAFAINGCSIPTKDTSLPNPTTIIQQSNPNKDSTLKVNIDNEKNVLNKDTYKRTDNNSIITTIEDEFDEFNKLLEQEN